LTRTPLSSLHCLYLTSLPELRAAGPVWDDLWWRSDVVRPTARAELLAQSIEHFQPHRGFHAVVVANGQQWVGALPLVGCRLIPAAGLPGNAWSPNGDLLLDPEADVTAVCDLLMAAVAELPQPLFWFNQMVPEAPWWQALLRACGRTRFDSCCHQQFRAGRVELDCDWETYHKRLPKHHRQNLHRAMRRLNFEGDVGFEMGSQLAVSEVEPWLRAAFELEDRGRRRATGTSVLRTRGMDRFFVAQAKQLARWGQLETAALRLDGQMLAFVYGFRAKGVYYIQRIGGDVRFAAFSPGQLLINHILQQLHREGEARALDFAGPLSRPLSRWRPATYGVGRIVLAPNRFGGRLAMNAYTNGWRPLERFKAALAMQLRARPTGPNADDSAILEPVKTIG
jgi:CelD/BcsL family acetyltransferase involved in cellulose biosynthesis